MLGLLLSLALAWAAPDANTLRTQWRTESPRLKLPVDLSEADFATLAAGEAVAHRRDSAGGAFAIGAIWRPSPAKHAWVVIQDGKDRPLAGGSRTAWLPGATATRRDVYMWIDLPWPLSDRHWVSRMDIQTDIHAATQGRVWQRRWTNAPNSPVIAKSVADPEAVWIEQNDGAWTIMEVGGGSLCVLVVRTVLGGAIPESISGSWAVSTLKGTMRQVAKFSSTAPQHYVAGHDQLYAPTGTALPFGLR